MTLQEFNYKSREEKITVCNNGIYLANLKINDDTISCYAIDGFFVEVIYAANGSKINDITSFKSNQILQKYGLDFHFDLIRKNIFVGF